MNLHTLIISLTFILFINVPLTYGITNYSNIENTFFIKKLDTIKWSVHNYELRKCYVNEGAHSTEVLRLYKDNFYEYCRYGHKSDKSSLYRDTGTYVALGPLLILNKTKKNRLSYLRNYKSSYFKGFNNLVPVFSFNKLSKTKVDKYNLPFYIDPFYGTIVSNRNSINKIDLDELILELTKNLETEQLKFDAIVDFICRSIEYGDGNNQWDEVSILAGNKRRAVCEGYAQTLNTLCDIAEIECRVVHGATKTSVSDIDIIPTTNHAWNIVKINSIYEIVDITWKEGSGDVWMHTPPSIMIYSHFPENEDDQLLNNPLTKKDIANAPVVMPEYEMNKSFTILPKYSPKSGLCYTDSVFIFIIDTIVNKADIRIYPNNVIDAKYASETKNENRWYSTKEIPDARVEYLNGKTIVNVNLKNLISGISVGVDNYYKIDYKVINGSKRDYMKLLQEKANNRYINSYTQGILASIYLNDKSKLAALVGDDNELFFNNKGNIKKELVDKFKNWEGRVPLWRQLTENHSNYGDNYTTIEDSFEFENLKIIFEKYENIYEILAIE